MIAGSTRAVAVLLVLTTVCSAGWRNTEAGKELQKRVIAYHQQLVEECSCFQYDKCDEYVKCIKTSNCPKWYRYIADAKESVRCEVAKTEFIDCGVGYDAMRQLLKDMDKEGLVTPTCVEPNQDNWKCKDVKQNRNCIEEFVAEFGCKQIVAPLEKEVCAGKSMLEALASRNLAKYANKYL